MRSRSRRRHRAHDLTEPSRFLDAVDANPGKGIARQRNLSLDQLSLGSWSGRRWIADRRTARGGNRSGGVMTPHIRSTPRSPKATDRAVSAYLAKCAQIADPEVARFGQLSPTRLSKAQQAKIPHEKSKGLRAGSNPSKRGLIIQGMLASPDRPSRGLVLRSEDAKESTMI